MYWEKVRAKAKIPIVIEKNMNEIKLLIPVAIISKENIIPKNIQSFFKENRNAVPFYIKYPTADKVVEGQVVFNILSNIT